MTNLNSKGEQAYKLVESLLYARRNTNVRAEQRAHDNLRKWCEDNNADMEQVIKDIRAYMIENSVNAGQNGII